MDYHIHREYHQQYVAAVREQAVCHTFRLRHGLPVDCKNYDCFVTHG
jgi:hypothetical protein